MLSNAYFLAKIRFDTAETEPAKNLQNLKNLPILLTPWPNILGAGPLRHLGAGPGTAERLGGGEGANHDGQGFGPAVEAARCGRGACAAARGFRLCWLADSTI